MYDTALPDETLRHVRSMAPAPLVVGVTSYRNPETIEHVVTEIGTALAGYFRHLDPVLVNVDGYSGDSTLEGAGAIGAPAPVRHVLTRYRGLPGRGSAARAVFDIATHLEARAVVLLEADVTSVDAHWLPTLAGPILAREVDIVLPHFDSVSPPSLISDFLTAPLLAALFDLTLPTPTPGQVAMTGDVATYLAGNDVWETDIARYGFDIWMTGEAVLNDTISAGQVTLAHKAHAGAVFSAKGDTTFLQKVSTLFRIIYHYRQYWQRQVAPPNIERLNLRAGSAIPPAVPTIPHDRLRRNLENAIQESYVQQEWRAAISGERYGHAERLLDGQEPACSAAQWAEYAYDFITAYHKGDGDPDKVISALYPLFLARCLAATSTVHDFQSYNAVVREQQIAFVQKLPHLRTRWNQFVPRYQMELQRQSGHA